MTVLTFDYSIANEGVTHTRTFYESQSAAWGVTPFAWNGQAFDVRPITVHEQDGSLFHPDLTQEHLENFLVNAGVPASLVISHAAAPDHIDLWVPFNSPDFLFLRVPADVPAPATWSSLVDTDYQWDSSPGWDDDAGGWVDAILIAWKAQLEQLALNPVTHVTLGNGRGILGTIDSADAIAPKEFMNIAGHPTIVDGSAYADVIEGGDFADTLRGNGGKDDIRGFKGDDDLFGGNAVDSLAGGADNDALSGGPGGDFLTGGAGKDLLTGGPGSDFFLFHSVTDSPPGAGRDVILDFSHAQGDTIGLSAIDADARAGHGGNQRFVFIGHDTFAHYHATHPGVFGMVRIAPGDLVQGNVNATLAPDFEIAVHGSVPVAEDFLL